MAQELKFAIVDIETTGGNHKTDRITEIGIAIHNGREVIDRFESLVNPETSIPPFIQRLTGISNEMVSEAPYFYEIAKQVVEMTEGCIFVAHNVKFDYYFIRMEFARLGYRYSKKQLCTKQLTKKLFPEIKRYSLENLIQHFNITVSARHRAMADVEATVEVFEHLIQADNEQIEFKKLINNGIKLSKLPGKLTIEDLHRIPESCGIYYFYGDNDHLLYVGKSKNIQKRVMQHFKAHNPKSLRLVERTRKIDFEITGSEILAILKEDEQIKKLKPEFNVAQRQSMGTYGIIIEPSKAHSNLILRATPVIDHQEHNYSKIFKNKSSAKKFVESIIDHHELTPYVEFKSVQKEIHILRKNGLTIFPENGIQDSWDNKWTEIQRQLNGRHTFHYLVIDPQYSSQEYLMFEFKKGVLQSMGSFDKAMGFQLHNLDQLNPIRVPLSINDQLIQFILKKNKNYQLHPHPIA